MELATDRYTVGLRAYQEAQATPNREREEFIRNRVEKLLSDKDMIVQLFACMTEGGLEDDNALWGVATASSRNWMSALATLHTRLTRHARKIAESEADHYGY